MRKIIIFGTGASAQKVLQNINYNKAHVVGFLDNNIKKIGQEYYENKIYNPMEINGLNYDFIIIASVKYEIIQKQLLELGVKSEDVIPYFAFLHSDYNRYREIIYVDGMLYDELNQKILDIDKYMLNQEYEIADKIAKKQLRLPKIKTIDDTILAIIEKKLSISRYGDGEFDLMFHQPLKFQNADDTIAKRLEEILVTRIENHIVGLADMFGELNSLQTKYALFFRDYMIKYREDYYNLLDMDREYYNAFITRFYSELSDKSMAKVRFKKIQNIWEQKEIVIVEGKESRLGVGNNLFDNAKKKERILCPSENAFEKYHTILETCLLHRKNKLFLIALGPTATVLAYDLAKNGFQAIDIGHLDLEYEWYLHNVQEHKIIIEGKYINEVVGGDVVCEIKDSVYESEIINIIL